MKTSILILFVSMVLNPVSSNALLCLDLRGNYANCQIPVATPEKVAFKVSQKLKAGEMAYLFDFNYQGKLHSLSIIADGETRPLEVIGSEPLPMAIEYVATCDHSSLIMLGQPKGSNGATAEKLTFTKLQDGSLQILDQSLVLGRVTQEKTVTCKRL